MDLPSPLEMLDDSGNEDTSQFYIEHIVGDNHDHDAVDLVSRGIFLNLKSNQIISFLYQKFNLQKIINNSMLTFKMTGTTLGQRKIVLKYHNRR